MRSTPAWHILGQSGLPRETLSLKKNKKQKTQNKTKTPEELTKANFVLQIPTTLFGTKKYLTFI